LQFFPRAKSVRFLNRFFTVNRRSFLALALTATLAFAMPSFAAEKDTRYFEMRTYYAAPGKLDALNKRFRDHTCKLFEKHGMTNLGYWMPIENSEAKLIYVLAYPSKEAREKSWKAFGADPDWKAAQKASEADGKLVAKAESRFMQATDFSPEAKPQQAGPRVFELRTYTTTPGNLERLLARFRNHTAKLFEKHGMTNLPYWTLQAGQPGADNTLIYLLAHKDVDAAKASFAAFRADPDWIKAKEASEKEGGGSLTVPDGVKSVFMQATDYSQTK
jgi:hypothetical protein